MKNLITGLFLAANGFFIAQSYADVVVVVSAKSEIGSVSEEDISRVFTGKLKTIAGVSQVVPINQNDGVEVRDKFYEKVCNKSRSQYKAYWAQLIFTGKGVPPKDIGVDADIKATVAANANMIGYMDAKFVDDTVKVVYKAL